MKHKSILELAVLGVSLLSGRSGHAHEPEHPSAPPKAEVIPKQLELFGRVRVDPYYWLNDRTNPKVRAYLEAENAYTDALMVHTKALQRSLYDEIVGRIKQADATAPVFDNGYYYYTRFEAGKQYPILVRKRGSLEAAKEVLLDENVLAAGQGYFSLGQWQVSPDNRKLAFAVDTGGRRFYTVRIKDLASGEVLDDAIADVTGNMAWANDSQTLFYTNRIPRRCVLFGFMFTRWAPGPRRIPSGMKRLTTRFRAGSFGHGPIAI